MHKGVKSTNSSLCLNREMLQALTLPWYSYLATLFKYKKISYYCSRWVIKGHRFPSESNACMWFVRLLVSRAVNEALSRTVPSYDDILVEIPTFERTVSHSRRPCLGWTLEPMNMNFGQKTWMIIVPCVFLPWAFRRNPLVTDTQTDRRTEMQ